MCSNCKSPLTAYSGQLNDESYKGNLAAQVDQLNVRPPDVYAMVAFLIIFAIGWPLRAIVTAFMGRATLNSETTNYLASAFGSIGPILTTIACLPIEALRRGTHNRTHKVFPLLIRNSWELSRHGRNFPQPFGREFWPLFVLEDDRLGESEQSSGTC